MDTTRRGFFGLVTTLLVGLCLRRAAGTPPPSIYRDEHGRTFYYLQFPQGATAYSIVRDGPKFLGVAMSDVDPGNYGFVQVSGWLRRREDGKV